jgi:hypothetical protein
MAVTYNVATITAPFSTGAQGLVDAITIWLTSIGATTLVSMDVWREDSPTYAGVQRARICYATGRVDAVNYQCTLFRSGGAAAATAGIDAAQQFNTLMATPAALVPVFTFDVTDLRGSASGLTFIGMLANVTSASSIGMSALIAEPTTPIAPGASGASTFYSPSGVALFSGTITNLAADDWPEGQRNYAVIDTVTGGWIGLASCCSDDLTPLVPPTLTTTTGFNGPAYVSQTPPIIPGAPTTTTNSSTTTTTPPPNPLCNGLDVCIDGRTPQLGTIVRDNQRLLEYNSWSSFAAFEGHAGLTITQFVTYCATACMTVGDDVWACASGLSAADREVIATISGYDCDNVLVSTQSEVLLTVTGPETICGKVTFDPPGAPAAHYTPKITVSAALAACFPEIETVALCMDAVAISLTDSTGCSYCASGGGVGNSFFMAGLPAPFADPTALNFGGVTPVDDGCAVTWSASEGGATVTLVITLDVTGVVLSTILTSDDGVGGICSWEPSTPPVGPSYNGIAWQVTESGEAIVFDTLLTGTCPEVPSLVG